MILKLHNISLIDNIIKINTWDVDQLGPQSRGS
jgi:hypothetical protein